jgi:hypothetical protein
LVGLIAPHVFISNYEFPAGLALCAALAVAILARQAAGSLGPLWGKVAAAALVGLFAGYVAFLAVVVRDNLRGYRVVARNFYGQLGIEDYGEPGDEGACRKLIHGVINHGQQMRSPEHRLRPTTYYCSEAGVGRAMRARVPGVPRSIGIVGLGCGTLLSYGTKGDTIRVYEINPLVVRYAESEFSYLRDTPAEVEIVGDARLSLEREATRYFDLLVIDAFAGDSIPVHLLTREAFQTYFRHLKPFGILAVHISNKFLDLQPVIERVGAHFGKLAVEFDDTPGDDAPECFESTWVLLMEPGTDSAMRAYFNGGNVLHAAAGFRMWTDDFSDMHRILRRDRHGGFWALATGSD